MSNEEQVLDEALEPVREITEEEKAAHSARAKEIEQEMIAEAERRAQDPSEVAATIYHMYLPKFKAGMKKLGVKARDRVWMHILEYPLHSKEHVAPTQLEKELFFVGHSIMEAKWVMVMDSMKNGMEKLVEKVDSPLTEEETSAIVNEFGFTEPKTQETLSEQE